MSENAEPEFHICSIHGCDEKYPHGRHALGYRTCHKHSQRDPMNRDIPPLLIVDVNKSTPSITRQIDFISPALAKTHTHGYSQRRSLTPYMRLSSRETIYAKQVEKEQ